MKKLHVIYVVDDGIVSLRCGVGTIAKHFVSAVPAIARRLKMRGIDLRLSVITLAPIHGGVGLRRDVYRTTQKICLQLKGSVILLPNNTRPKDNYFSFEKWKKYNLLANKAIQQNIHASDAHTLVIANDIIFSKVRTPKQKTSLVWMPHSLANIHRQSYGNVAIREKWEYEMAEHVRRADNAYIGYISPNVKKLVQKTFQLPSTKLVPFFNGFHIPSLQRSVIKPKKQILTYLQRRSVSLHKPIILAFARADEYKGLEKALQVMLDLTRSLHLHGIFIASRFSNEKIVKNVQEPLRQMIKGNEKYIQAFFGYEFSLPKYLLQYHKTKVLLHLPTRDFYPLIPFEAGLIGHDKLIVVNSHLPAYFGVFQHMRNAFIVSQETEKAIMEVKRILAMSPHSRQRVVASGRKKIAKMSNIETNYLEGIVKVWRNSS